MHLSRQNYLKNKVSIIILQSGSTRLKNKALIKINDNSNEILIKRLRNYILKKHHCHLL